MNLTKKSNQLLELFIKSGLKMDHNLTAETNTSLKELYSTFDSAFKFVKTVSNKDVSLQLSKINKISDIPRPSSFPPNSIPTSIREHIEVYSASVYKYSLQIYERNITVYFITELTNPQTNTHIKEYNAYFRMLLVWLYIVNEYSLEKCSADLNIYIYHTSLTKELPNSKNDIIGETNANTAFTRTCPSNNSEIVIFRKEEWFKVFIHETMHNFGLDFSDANTTDCTKYILTKFNAKSAVNLYEAYTEFWARIINICFCSFVSSNNFETFKNQFQNLISIEICYSCFQMTKVLKYMNLDYVSLITNKASKNIYKEDTSVLSYYIITFVLMYYYQDFLLWCETNNSEIISFKNTQKNIQKFCEFIGRKYNTPDLLSFINLIEKVNITNTFFNKNLRMTLCELDKFAA
jgi:hypothetical protein